MIVTANRADLAPAQGGPGTPSNVLDRFERYRRVHLPFALQWFRLVSYFHGIQHLSIRRSNNDIVPIPAADGEFRATHNYGYAHIMRKVATLIRARPVPRAYPRHDDAVASASALVANRGLDWEAWQNAGEEIDILKLVWAFVTGNAITFYSWDSKAHGGRVPMFEMTTDADGNEVPIRDLRGQPVQTIDRRGRPRWENVGRVVRDVAGPLEVLVDSDANNLAEAQWIARSRRMNVDRLREAFPEHRALIRPSASTDLARHYDRILHVSTSAGGASYSDVASGSSTNFTEYWEKATEAHPEGRYITFADRTILSEGPNQYRFCRNEFPVTILREMPALTRFWALSTFEQEIPVIDEINITAGAIMENRNHNIHPRILLPEECNVDPAMITNAAGGILEYSARRGVHPSILHAPPVSPDGPNLLAFEQGVLEKISGDTDIRMGKAQGELRSGTMASILLEQSNMALEPIHKLWAREAVDGAEMVLKIIDNFAPEGTKFQILGPDRVASDLSFDDLDPDLLDITVEDVDENLLSRATQRALVMEELGAGVWNLADPVTRAQIMETLNAGLFRKVARTDEAERRRTLDNLRRLEHDPDDASVRARIWQKHEVAIVVIQQNLLESLKEDDRVMEAKEKLLLAHLYEMAKNQGAVASVAPGAPSVAPGAPTTGAPEQAPMGAE